MSASTFQVERTTVVGYPIATTTVPKQLVHRASGAEVMLTDWRREDSIRFSTTAQWPHRHSFFTSVDNDQHDPLVAAETIRQIGILLAHAEFGVPFGHQFLLRDLRIAVQPQHLFVGNAPALLDIDVTCTEVKRHRDSVAGLRYEAVFRREGTIVATAGAPAPC